MKSSHKLNFPAYKLNVWEVNVMYNSYEEYMQTVLGMNMPNTYMPNNNVFRARNV